MELDDAGLASVESGELFEGIVEDEDVDGAVLRREDGLVKGDLALHSSALACMPLAGVIDEDVAH